MTWTWLVVWNASWLVFALLWVSLESKLVGDPPQGGPGPDKFRRREVEPPRKRLVRAPRGLRPVRALRVHRR